MAILDIDMHHGNGTQGIFYHRADVLTISLHGDPRLFTPFFTGHAHERAGDGLRATTSTCRWRGTGDEAYGRAARRLRHAARLRAGALVVALGLDAHERDPYQAPAVTTPGFARITAEIARLGLPTVLVQEGGYLSDDLGPNLSRLRGFEGRHECAGRGGRGGGTGGAATWRGRHGKHGGRYRGAERHRAQGAARMGADAGPGTTG